MRLSIKNLIGSRCIIKEDGQMIYDHIHNSLLSGEPVILDFEGVNQFASPFFNFAIGQLLKDVGEPDIWTLLQIDNLNKAGNLVVKKVIENAAKYYGDKDYSKIVDDILEQQTKEQDE